MSYRIINITKKNELNNKLDYLPNYYELNEYYKELNISKYDNIIAITTNSIYKIEKNEWKFDRFINLKYINEDSDSDSNDIELGKF
jgi:hypothetical protein